MKLIEIKNPYLLLQIIVTKVNFINNKLLIQSMSVNRSKTNQARFWKKWIESGAVGAKDSKLHYCLKHGNGTLRDIVGKENINQNSTNADKVVSPLEFTMSRINIDFFNGSGEGTTVYFDVPDHYIGKPVEALHSYWKNQDGSNTEGVLLSSNGRVIGQQYIRHFL